MTTKRFAGEVVKLTRDCDLGQEGERAVVVRLESSSWTGAVAFMKLCFFDREPGCREVNTGADYRFLRTC